LCPLGVAYPTQGTNTFHLTLMKEALFYDDTSSHPIIIVVGKVFLPFIFAMLSKLFCRARRLQRSKRTTQKRWHVQCQAEQIAHLKGLFFQSVTHSTSALSCSATFWCNHSMTDIYSEEEQLLACQQSKS
jgi:hypothetical protein